MRRASSSWRRRFSSCRFRKVSSFLRLSPSASARCCLSRSARHESQTPLGSLVDAEQFEQGLAFDATRNLTKRNKTKARTAKTSKTSELSSDAAGRLVAAGSGSAACGTADPVGKPKGTGVEEDSAVFSSGTSDRLVALRPSSLPARLQYGCVRDKSTPTFVRLRDSVG